MRPAKPAAGGRHERVLLRSQVDGHTLDVEKLGDPPDGGLEGVRERELRGRLADDPQDCALTLEVELECARPCGRSERVRRPDPEGREARELGFVRLLVGGEQELQDADRWLPERQDRRDAAARRQVLGRDRSDGNALLERLGGELACRSDLAAGVEAVRAGKEEPPVFLLPQQPDARSDEVRCDTADLRRRVGLVERRGQCLAHELEHGRTGKLDSVAVARGERAEHERGVMRGELGAEALRFREVLPHAVELEGCRCPVRSNRDEHERVRSRARRRMTYRTRRIGEARQGCLRQLTRR